MEFLWNNGPATGDVVRTAVSKDRSLTDSTIRTVLRRLEAKQFVKHEMDGRQFIYSSSREPRKVAAEAAVKVESNNAKYSFTSIVYKDDHSIKEIYVGGTTTRIVFESPSSAPSAAGQK